MSDEISMGHHTHVTQLSLVSSKYLKEVHVQSTLNASGKATLK